MTGYILAIDQGTTSSRAIVFDGAMKPVATAQKEFTQRYPASGWVEHDPEEIWDTVVWAVKEALRSSARLASSIGTSGWLSRRSRCTNRNSNSPAVRSKMWYSTGPSSSW